MLANLNVVSVANLYIIFNYFIHDNVIANARVIIKTAILHKIAFEGQFQRNIYISTTKMLTLGRSRNIL